jgi:hypothetical protein
MRHLFPSLFIVLFSLYTLGCVSGPLKTATESTDTNGNLIVVNQSGFELAFYVDKRYKKTTQSGERLSILIDYAEDTGTVVAVDVFQRDRLDNVETYPTDNRALYCSFAKVVRPLGSPEKVNPIYIRQLSQEFTGNAEVVNVLVRFSYNDDPQLLSAATVFTGSLLSPNPIVMLQNGNTMLAPMPVGLNQINIEYVLLSERAVQRKTYPQTQRNDPRFQVYITSDAQEVSYMIPKISDIFNVSYASDSGVTIGDPILP